MPTFTALTTLKGKDRAEALSLALENLDPAPTGVGTFEVEDGSGLWEVGGYFVEKPDEIGLALLAAANGARPFAISELPETDWVAQVRRELSPVRAGRFFVYGSHDADKVPDDVVPLLIEAAMAFGTGHHGTTQGCLTALEALVARDFMPKSIIDVGCGTAVLAMAAAHIWDVPNIASDIDEVATDTARANIEHNGLKSRVDVVTAAGFEDARITKSAPYDLIFANILKGPLLDLKEDMAELAAQGGYIILSGILVEQADEVTAAYEGAGFALDDRLEIGEWATLTLMRG